jgi:hypothetical protein
MKYARVAEIAGRLESCAVIGAYALAAHGYVRQTADFDLLTTDRKALQPKLWERERADGMQVDVHHGDLDDPLAGVARIRSADFKVDVVVAKYRWQAAVIERAELKQFGEVMLRVPRIGDLVLLKVDAGGYLDLRDAIELLAISPRERVLAELRDLAAALPDDLQRRLADFLQNNSSIGS